MTASRSEQSPGLQPSGSGSSVRVTVNDAARAGVLAPESATMTLSRRRAARHTARDRVSMSPPSPSSHNDDTPTGRGGEHVVRRLVAAGGEPGQDLEDLARRARDGDGRCLEALVLAIQDRVYGLAVRMLWHPEDARDAAQEILIRIVTRLGSFRGDSSFATWVYRVAANYLLDVRRSRLEERSYTFERFGEELDRGLSDAPAPEASGETALLLEEIKVGCTLAMLTCLDRPHRLAYILGEILEMEGAEAARVLEIGAGAFRKHLSRAREAVVTFTRAKCGL